ncbi:hypothetical protein KUTeg_008806 [Tegillarca granosa]|uniref:G-protein coupled receptors family 2 profile 2 domain-containing protein n=1 Tax=Tegillarca granosa TaxID=220873 RepID=A0ABQ9FD78_TEGGR|nr:hypothetical protein KUTeg_008806 [Tegillarca granosa]
MRSTVSFIKENLLVEGLGFPGDVYFTADNKIHFKVGIHWECRLFFSMYNYIIAANYTWIFVEALYLQMLISVAVFSEKSRSKWYILFGWTFPLTFIIPWVCLRTSEMGNEYCWNTYYKSPKLLWVIYGPITASIIVNFLIFINIVRILFTKLNASPCPETKIFRYRRLAKSTLILIPLFGVYYIVFTINTYGGVKGKAEVVMMYAELFFNSFQGFLLSLLFCFFNGEVQTEIKKVWKRHRLQRSGSKSKSTVNYHSRITRHRHSELQNGDVNNEENDISSDIKESSFSGVPDTELCTNKTNGVLLQGNLQDISECTPCLDRKQKDETYSNTDTLECEKSDCQNMCRNNNHTTICVIDHSNSDYHEDDVNIN